MIERLAERIRVDATDRGVSLIRLGGGGAAASPVARRHAARARAQIAEYLAGRRVSFTVEVDLTGLSAFQQRVLDGAGRVGFGAVVAYGELARRIGRPSAARAVGNALAANPVPLLVPCHRFVRRDGGFGRYLLGHAVKRALLALERNGRAPLTARGGARASEPRRRRVPPRAARATAPA